MRKRIKMVFLGGMGIAALTLSLQFAAFAVSPVIEQGSQMANPFLDFDTLAEAEESAGFSLTAPETLFTDYTDVTYRAMPGQMIELIYRVPQEPDGNGADGDPAEGQSGKITPNIVRNGVPKPPRVDGDEIRIRKATGNGDISGDYNSYLKTAEVSVGELVLIQKGAGDDTVNTEYWNTDEFAYSITTVQPRDHDTMAKLAQMIQ